MKKLSLLTTLGLMAAIGPVSAQTGVDRCAHNIIMERAAAKNPATAQKFQEQFDELGQIQSAPQGTASKTTGVVTIPVIFHIVLNTNQQTQLQAGGATFLSRMISQIETINTDFGGTNADSTNIPAAFKPYFGKSNIRFAPAHRRPDSHSTLGYEVITTTKNAFDLDVNTAGSQDAFSDAKYTSSGGAAAWDPNKYLNVWIINMTENGGSATGILGICFSPQYIDATFGQLVERGICINYGAFGKRTSATQYFISGIDRGRTLTHELGHYFELRHIWGDTPGCSPDDNISDTPPQANANYGTPSFPKTDACAGTNGAMFMNYMDYVNDASMQMFTKNQVTVMNTMSTTESVSLTQNPDLLDFPLDVAKITGGEVLFGVSPNPASSTVTLTMSDMSSLKAVSIMNMMGQVVKSVPLSSIRGGIATIDVSGLSKGVYMVQCQFEGQTRSEKLLLQ